MLVLCEVLLIGAAITRIIKRSYDGFDIALISLAVIIIIMILAINYLENLKEDSLHRNANYLDDENDRLIQINQALVTINRIQESQLIGTRQSQSKLITPTKIVYNTSRPAQITTPSQASHHSVIFPEEGDSE